MYLFGLAGELDGINTRYHGLAFISGVPSWVSHMEKINSSNGLARMDMWLARLAHVAIDKIITLLT